MLHSQWGIIVIKRVIINTLFFFLGVKTLHDEIALLHLR